MEYQLLDIRTNYAKNKSLGGLSITEAGADVPFDFKRFYYIHGVSAGVKRGYHAHKELRQLLICPVGEIRILLDNGKEKCYVTLDDPSKGLLVEPYFWHTMEWMKDNSLLMVLASDHYDESDYLRDYSDFLAYYNVENGEVL